MFTAHPIAKRAEALALADEVGVEGASKQTGIPARTIYQWRGVASGNTRRRRPGFSDRLSKGLEAAIEAVLLDLARPDVDRKAALDALDRLVQMRKT